MPIEIGKSGSALITGKGIDLYRLHVLKMGLKAELRGMKLTRGANCFKMVKQEFGLKGTKQEIYEQFLKLVEEENKKVVRVYDKSQDPDPEATAPTEVTKDEL